MAASAKGGGMGATRERSGAPDISQRRWLHALTMVWTFMIPPVWSHARLLLAMTTPVVATIALIGTAAELATPDASNSLALALTAGGSLLALLAWIRFVAIPFATKGKLPNGRYLADVLARRRMLRQRERDRRQALRQRRDRPDYRGPHAHRRRDNPRSPREEA
jgi:hypothetical protein